MSECIDLEQIAGKRFRIDRDPAYRAEHGARARVSDPWLTIIPCRRGHLYPHSADRIGFASNGRYWGRKVAELAGVRIEQEGEDGINVSFPIELFERVAALVKPKRRRQVTEAERQRLADIGKAGRFPGKTAVNGTFAGLESMQTTSRDSEAT